MLSVQVGPVRLVEQLNAVAHALHGCTDLRHLPDGLHGKLDIATGLSIRREEVKDSVRGPLIATSAFIPRLPTRGAVQVWHNPQACAARKVKDLVDPLHVLLCRHHPLQIRPAGLGRGWPIRRLSSGQVNQVPIGHRQAHNIESLLLHPAKVLELDVHIEVLCHAAADVRCLNVADAPGTRALKILVCGCDACVERILAGQLQELLRDKASAVVDTAQPILCPWLPDATLSRGVAPNVTSPPDGMRIPDIPSAHRKVEVPHHVNDSRV
mmetsp:Transcript_28874/g.65265  ORF Transcript_28874/g.65265 Transcript_28874/m.65265 type:complete len:268 (-) Transcript_28874:862-1665(-)